ncbi:MAG TPA: hypothetical protein VNF68_10175 [Candidatus Baltobacteraceae bacterium]|nr:hypothetical protein [Candidatus Baltobacteraceae bacterium]
MLRKHTLGFTGVLVAAVAIAIVASGCSSTGAGQVVSVGPTFASQSLYATNTTQNGISIYPAGTKTGAGPQYQIGGSNTTLAGPQYVTLDSLGDIFTTNWSASTGTANILEFKALATGNVLPYNGAAFGSAHPRGIFDYQTTFASSTTKTDVLVVAVVDPTQPLSFSSQLQFLEAAFVGGGTYNVIAGPLTGLDVPVGVAADSSGNIYVANSQGTSGANVEVFSVPSPSPTPSPTATPTASPTPTPTPSGATASPVPTPSPTATPENIAPLATLTSEIGTPTGIALDANGNIYVADQASTVCSPHCPAILRFAASPTTGAAPTGAIAGAATLLFAPTDVKVDSTGLIYVADSTSAGAGVVYVFAAGASGNVAPIATFSSPGSVTGLGLSP